MFFRLLNFASTYVWSKTSNSLEFVNSVYKFELCDFDLGEQTKAAFNAEIGTIGLDLRAVKIRIMLKE